MINKFLQESYIELYTYIQIFFIDELFSERLILRLDNTLFYLFEASAWPFQSLHLNNDNDYYNYNLIYMHFICQPQEIEKKQQKVKKNSKKKQNSKGQIAQEQQNANKNSIKQNRKEKQPQITQYQIYDDLYGQIQIIPSLMQIKYKCIVIKNGLPTILNSSKIVPEVTRVLSKINSSFNLGLVCINIDTRLITYKFQSLLDKTKFQEIKKMIPQRTNEENNQINTTPLRSNINHHETNQSNQINRFNQNNQTNQIKETNNSNTQKKNKSYLSYLYNFAKQRIKQTIRSLRLVLGQIPQESLKTLYLPENDFRIINHKQQSQIIQQLNKIESISHKHFKFMDSKFTKPQPISKENESENESSFKIYHDNNQVQQNSDDEEDKKISQKQEQDYKQLLIHRKIIKNKQNEKINIYSQIKILKVQQVKWIPLSEGAFGIIQRANVKYHYIQNTQDDSITKIMVKKSDKLVNQSSKVQEEKEILSQLKNYASATIIKCYYTDQTYNKINTNLLIDYYTFRSLAHYIKSMNKCLSLSTKIILICQIIQGMRFLRDLGIVHHDLKEQNILIGKSLFLKITDFGQSIHLGSSKKKKSGYSIPFVAPQRFHIDQPITPKMDTFSIGVLMHQLMFQQYPFIMRYMSQEKLIKEYENNNSINRIFINPEKLNYYQCSILRIIYTISLKCLHPNLKMRPDLDWIQIIMRKLFDRL